MFCVVVEILTIAILLAKLFFSRKIIVYKNNE